MAESSPKGEEKSGGIGEIACYKQFLLFPLGFKRLVLQTSKNKGLFGKGLNDSEQQSLPHLYCLQKVPKGSRVPLGSIPALSVNSQSSDKISDTSNLIEGICRQQNGSKNDRICLKLNG